MDKKRWHGGTVNCLDQKKIYVKNSKFGNPKSPQFWDRDLTSSYGEGVAFLSGGAVG